MKIADLINHLSTFPLDAEVRIGDQVEAGPYTHWAVASLWRVPTGVVICADPDSQWIDESTTSLLEPLA